MTIENETATMTRSTTGIESENEMMNASKNSVDSDVLDVAVIVSETAIACPWNSALFPGACTPLLIGTARGVLAKTVLELSGVHIHGLLISLSNLHIFHQERAPLCFVKDDDNCRTHDLR